MRAVEIVWGERRASTEGQMSLSREEEGKERGKRSLDQFSPRSPSSRVADSVQGRVETRDEDHDQPLPRRRVVAVEPETGRPSPSLNRRRPSPRRRRQPRRRPRRRRRRGRVRYLSSRVRRLLSRLQGARRRLSSELSPPLLLSSQASKRRADLSGSMGRVHARVSHALPLEVVEHRQFETAMPNGPTTLGYLPPLPLLVARESGTR